MLLFWPHSVLQKCRRFGAGNSTLRFPRPQEMLFCLLINRIILLERKGGFSKPHLPDVKHSLLARSERSAANISSVYTELYLDKHYPISERGENGYLKKLVQCHITVLWNMLHRWRPCLK
ncbi:hypothetical protein XELAEV_18016949mg [Xenopus laevis]|uniref:Uncharacterized protein n=1 Tax=Xenopus laevis TaxID=8355 RepID=A0A974DBI5_XENLA|nr:hypothetical protein XELAEV_18016949mg [Xenopus laevis]